MTNRVEAARSVLARPGQVALEVDGYAVDLEQLTLTDQDGTPRLTCELGDDLARAAERAAGAVLRLDTRPGDRDPDGRPVDRTLTLAGALGLCGVVACECCQQARHVVALDADFVLLTTWSRVGGRRFVVGRPERIDATEFRSAKHQLNPGYLRSAAEHATDCHQEELRQALASRTRTAPQDMIAVQLAVLTPRSVELVWVDRAGAHSTTLAFPRRVRDPRELAATLRSRLGVDAC